MMKTKFFILFIVIVVLLVGGLGMFLGKGKSAKLDAFAQALKANGAEFYGAFWCPHCQEQKAEFGNSKKYLPYIECSNPDNSQKQICIDNKIESYPSWKFKNGVSINSDKEPLVCNQRAGDTVGDANSVCNQVSSEYFKTWIFPDYQFSIKSPVEPVKEGNIWKFDSSAIVSGKLPLSFLAEQIGYTLPQ